MTAIRRAMAGVALLAALAGCGDGATEPASDDNDNGSNTSGRTIKADPSFATDIQEIFERTGCTNGGCHGTSAQAGLNLTSGQARANLVNVDATSENVKRVIPGNANASYLVIKLEGRQTVGQRMPRGGSALDATDMGNIKNWINQGAKNN